MPKVIDVDDVMRAEHFERQLIGEKWSKVSSAMADLNDALSDLARAGVEVDEIETCVIDMKYWGRYAKPRFAIKRFNGKYHNGNLYSKDTRIEN